VRNKEKEMEFGLAYIYKEYIEKQFFYLASVKSWSVSYSRERAHALGHLIIIGVRMLKRIRIFKFYSRDPRKLSR
jgi:hypothetical protein